MSKERNDHITATVHAKLQQWERNLLPVGLEKIGILQKSSVDWLRLICIQQRRQVETLARAC